MSTGPNSIPQTPLTRRIPALRYSVAGALATLVAVSFDRGSASMAVEVLLVGALSVFALALLAIDVIVGCMPASQRSARVLRYLGVVAMVGPGLGYGLWACWTGDLPYWAPVAIVATAGACGGIARWAKWPGGYDAARWSRGVFVAATLTSSLHFTVHWLTGTLRAVRPGTESLHLALFIGTWLASAAVALAFATRYAGEPTNARRWLSVGMAAATGATGLVVLYVDRVMLVDLYAAVHLWLGVIGFLALELGFRMLLSLRRSAALGWAGLASIVALAAAGGGLVACRGSLGDVAVRSELKNSALGASALLVLPQPKKSRQLPVDLRHPALEFEHYLDEWPPNERLNVLLVSIDAMRADAVGPVDEPSTEMPVIASLARESVRFRRAYSQGSRTAMAMSCLSLGRYSANIDWNLWLYRGGLIFDTNTLSPEKIKSFRGKFVFTTIPTFHEGTPLAERLKGAGYDTAAVLFAQSNKFFGKGVGFEKGFDTFEDLTKSGWVAPSSDKVADLALERLRQFDGSPWFLWVHFYDPHENKKSKEKYHRLLAHTDHAVGRLLEEVKRRGEYDRTVVVMLSDHGEAFGEHKHFGHTTSLYEEQVRVPLLIRLPGEPGRDELRPVATIDATATIVALTRSNTRSLDGVNLMPLITEGRYPEVRPVFTELHRFLSNKGKRTKDLKAVVWGDDKLIVDRLRDTAELYDLSSDPGESKNLIREDRATYERLSDLLNRFIEAGEREHPLP